MLKKIFFTINLLIIVLVSSNVLYAEPADSIGTYIWQITNLQAVYNNTKAAPYYTVPESGTNAIKPPSIAPMRIERPYLMVDFIIAKNFVNINGLFASKPDSVKNVISVCGTAFYSLDSFQMEIRSGVYFYIFKINLTSTTLDGSVDIFTNDGNKYATGKILFIGKR